MKRTAAFLLGFGFLLVGCSGCADKRVAIYQIGAESGFGLFGDLVAAGCVVEVKGEPTGLHITYKDEKCDVEFGTTEPLPMSGDL